MTSWTVACRLLCPWNFPGTTTGVGSHSFLQRTFPPCEVEPVSPSLQAISLPSEAPDKSYFLADANVIFKEWALWPFRNIQYLRGFSLPGHNGEGWRGAEGGRKRERMCVCVGPWVVERELHQNQLKSSFETTLRNSGEPSGNQEWKTKVKQKGLFRNICPHFSEKTWSSEKWKSFAQWHTAGLMAAPLKGVEIA